ncbi:MAG TPA: LysR family transcriptional regulator [Gammaproteobacteria bacterium]|nr:LysR family transcriptional regulator [Gammaproteobacteria bacterium]HEV2613582.1 LysR family transcriptional regulator [Gammaproteobacteria bacterium]
MRITLKQIEVFVTLAKTSNMTRASETLHMTQSACSMALSTMESQLGGVLFDRQGKKLILNERGKVVFPKAANIITQVQELQDVMRGKKEVMLAGQLIVGASTTIGNYLLPGMIGNFVTRYPHTKITLCVENTERIIEKVLKFDIDVGMIEGNCYSDEIDVFPWKKDELIVIASPKHSLAKQKKMSLSDLQNAKWILREVGSGTREKFEEAMRGKIHPFLELGHTEAVKQAVCANLGISCLSRTAVSDLLKRGQLVELKTPFLKLTRDFYVLLHKKKHKTALLSKFMAEL